MMQMSYQNGCKFAEPPHLPILAGQLREELRNITQHATQDKVLDLSAAMGKFKEHTLRGKGTPGPDEWKVGNHLVCTPYHLDVIVPYFMHRPSMLSSS